ncbi:MAG: hypothetical protein LBE76_04315 [Nitrososphaerota archaeon]|nr:hypothetical protein [Nitrososphaerota archaeon]
MIENIVVIKIVSIIQYDFFVIIAGVSGWTLGFVFILDLGLDLEDLVIGNVLL